MAKWNVDDFTADLDALAARNRRQVWMIYGLLAFAVVGWML